MISVKTLMETAWQMVYLLALSVFRPVRMDSLYANGNKYLAGNLTDYLSVPWLTLFRLRPKMAHTVPTHYHHPLV